MADSLPSPPTSRESTPHNDIAAPDADDLTRRLDELLEQYLEILDEYTTLREQLSKTFSDGFMWLAHAQRTSNLGPGRRYGQDGYDGRMKASRRVGIECRTQHEENKKSNTGNKSSSTGGPSGDIYHEQQFSITSYPQKVHLSTGKETGHDETLSELKADVSDVSTKQENKSVHDGKQTNDNIKKSRIDPAYRDPVTWYGILVPQALRQSQKTFALSVEDVIPKLLSTTCLLRSLESRIWIIREELGTKETLPENEVRGIPHRSANPTIQQ